MTTALITIISALFSGLVVAIITTMIRYHELYSRLVGEICKYLYDVSGYKVELAEIKNYRIVHLIASSCLPIKINAYIMWYLFEVKSEELNQCTRWYHICVSNPNGGGASSTKDITPDFDPVVNTEDIAITNQYINSYGAISRLLPSFWSVLANNWLPFITKPNTSGIKVSTSQSRGWK